MNDVLNSRSIRQMPEFLKVIKKLTLDPKELTEEEKLLALSCAIIFLRAYDQSNSPKSYIELAYYIILKYSLTFEDYEPLFDVATNLGFYPIVHALVRSSKIGENQEENFSEGPVFSSISSALIPERIRREFSHGNVIETFEQKKCRTNLIHAADNAISYVAPTSFGKSNVIAEHLKNNWSNAKRVAIIVPSKSLLLQTYRLVKSWALSAKILIHDEMYDKQNRFIGIFTQERALRLLDKNSDLYFDYLYIDEAHNLFDNNDRSILLTRLIRQSLLRNPKARIIYLSPLVGDSGNLALFNQNGIAEQRIRLNIKEPEYFDLEKDGTIYKYNRFVNDFYVSGHPNNIFQYIGENQTDKSFFYLYSPAKIEKFARELANQSAYIANPSIELNDTIYLLKKYVHEDFYAVEYLRKGIIYLHGKLPDNVKDFLEHKFSKVQDIKSVIANSVILEGINLPIDSLFIMSGHGLTKNKLVNLIGRVNRLDRIFQNTPHLEKLFPKVHFLNSDIYDRKNGNMKSKIKLLKESSISDELKNPLLKNYDISKEEPKDRKVRKEIISKEDCFFSDQLEGWHKLKKDMIALNMNAIYVLSDELCQRIFSQINEFSKKNDRLNIHFLDRLQRIFVTSVIQYIKDDEFIRLNNDRAINYYKLFFENRNKSLKELIELHIKRFKFLINKNKPPLLYVGKSFGEVFSSNQNQKSKVYVDLSTKNKKQLVNLAIIKQKLEEDFVSYKLHMFFQLMYDYDLLTIDEYNSIIYGSTDLQKIKLVKMGLTMNLINKLNDDDQLKNITVDQNGNINGNSEFSSYKEKLDDFLKFELDKYI